MIFDPDIIGPWVCARHGGTYVHGSASAIGRVRDGEIVGGIIYEDFNGANVICHIASEGRSWLNRTFLWMIFDYPFRQLKVKRMTAPIASVNRQARRFVERLGFEEECALKDAHPEGDLIIYRMVQSNARRWLELKNEQR